MMSGNTDNTNKGALRNCKSIQSLLSEYVDGTLPDNTAWDVKLHCMSCAVCNRIAEDFSATANLLSTLPTEEPSLNFEAMLARRIADVTLAPRRPSFLERSREAVRDLWARPRIRPVMAAGAVMAAILPAAVVMVGHNRVTPDASASVPAPLVGRAVAQGANREESAQLREMWRGHAAYSASEPLGDPASVLVAGNDSF